LWRIMPFNGV